MTVSPQLGGLDAAVANAGVLTVGTWDKTTQAQWRTVLDVNLIGTWNTCAAAIPHLVERGGSLVNISSAAGLKGTPLHLPYTASKHGVVGLSRALANELAAQNIRVNTVHPTGVETGMRPENLQQILAEGRPDLIPIFLNALPAVMAEAIDISNAVLFLVSDESRYRDRAGVQGRRGGDVAMTTVDTDRSERGRREFAEVMTFAPPEDSSPGDDERPDRLRLRRGLDAAGTEQAGPPVRHASVRGGGRRRRARCRDHVYAALNSGDLSITEMRETVLHFAVYSGWPKASRFNIVVDEQWERIHRERGQTVPPPEPATAAGHAQRPGGTAADRRAIVQGHQLHTVRAAYATTRIPGAGILNFVFGEMWLRPGLGMKERRLVTVACVAFQDAPIPILSHVYAALKSRDVSFDEMDEVALHFGAYYGWAKASHLNQVIGEQKQRVLDEWQAEAR